MANEHYVSHVKALERNSGIAQNQDILHVKEVLGHRNINNTLIYIKLEKAISKTSNDEFIVKAVDNVQEACKLL